MSLRIGLIDVDSHNFPNLALMKLSSWHKAQGDTVEKYEPLQGEYDKVYVSKVFDFTPDYEYPIYADEIIYGGTGYNLTSNLPDEIEHCAPDYKLYGDTKTAYGFLTRGCPRDCEFCIVSEKEGCQSRKVANVSSFWNGQKEIKLLDPNLLACVDRIELLEQLVDSRAWIDFTQGLDIRCMNETITALLMQCKIKMLHFAWDGEQDSSLVCRNLRAFKEQTKIDKRKASVYVLTNYDTSFEFDLYRVNELKAMGFDPYIMVYDKRNAPQNVRRLQRWVNNKIIFRSCERFEEYTG